MNVSQAGITSLSDTLSESWPFYVNVQLKLLPVGRLPSGVYICSSMVCCRIICPAVPIQWVVATFAVSRVNGLFFWGGGFVSVPHCSCNCGQCPSPPTFWWSMGKNNSMDLWHGALRTLHCLHSVSYRVLEKESLKVWLLLLYRCLTLMFGEVSALCFSSGQKLGILQTKVRVVSCT